MMTIDNKAMLDRVAADVFSEGFVITVADSDVARGSHAIRVASSSHGGRAAIIGAGHLWLDAFIPELNVQTGLLVDDGEVEDEDEDEIEAYRAEELKKICQAMHAYLRGEGRVSEPRSLLGRGTVRKLVIESNGLEWRLGRNHWSGPAQL